MSLYDFFASHFMRSARVDSGNILRRRDVELEQLEDRTLYDASPLASPGLTALPESAVADSVDQVASEAPTANIAGVRELVIIDGGVDDYQQLLRDMSLRGSSYEIVLLDSDQSGIEQLTKVLSQYDQLDAIHLVSHGRNAALQLGSDWLTNDSLNQHEADVASWGAALSEEGDLLLYGCELGKSSDGLKFVDRLAAISGADVAASDDITGHRSQQGDWELEIETGAIEVSLPFSQAALSGWQASLAAPIQEFYIPMLESEIFAALDKIYTQATVDDDIVTVIGITATQDNTIVTYDHHEDGYEADIAAPAQSTTLVWGDGNLMNGAAPGLVGDIINAGDVIVLQNTVPATPGGTFYFDGTDRFVSDQLVAATRAGWSPSPGTVLAGTVEVTDTTRWGTEYTVPLGEDTAGVFDQYQYTGIYILAQTDGTVVDIDSDADGTDDISVTLNQGDTYHVDGGVLQGATISSTVDIQVDLITGDRDSLVDSRWYLLRPTADWSDTYINPVGTTVSTDPARIVIFNPNAAAIMVDVQTQGGTVSLSVDPGDSNTYLMPNPVAGEVSGALVSSQGGEDFYAVMSMDSDAAHTAYDWGFSLLPESGLTQMVVSGWAPGTEDFSENGSPVWVTATSATNLYIDLDSDPSTGALIDPFGNRYDELRPINALESERIFDNSDNDNSGIRVYTIDGTLLASAWGLDPDIGGGGLPYLDLGTIVLPFPVPTITKTATLANDVNNNGLFDPGDTVLWTITIQNNDGYDMNSIVSYDELPANNTYVAGSTTVDGVTVGDDMSGATLLPLDEMGLGTADILPGGSAVITFQTLLDSPPPIYSVVDNTVIVSSNQGVTGTSTSFSVNNVPNLTVTKDDGGATTVAGGTVVYSINYANIGTADASGVTLTETLPSNATFNAGSSTSGWTETGVGTGVFEFSIGALAVNANGSVNFAVTVASPLPSGVAQLSNSVSITDDGMNGVDSDPSDNNDTDVTPVVAAPNLFVTKDDGVVSIAAGGAVVYTVNYGNSGSQDATGVVLTEILPTGATFDSGNSSVGWTETAPNSGIYTLTVGALSAGSNGAVMFAVTVDDPQAAGVEQLTNSVAIADDGANGPDEDASDNSDDDIDTLVAAPDLFVSKDDSQSIVTAGGSAVYAINYGNSGSQGATGVVLTETLPVGATFDAGNSTAGWTETAPNSGVYTLTIGALASGASGSATFAVTVDDPQDAGVDQLFNMVSIADDGANGADENLTNNSDDDTDTLVAAPDLFVTKDDGATSVQAGNLVVYTINYGNNGSQAATGVVLTETLPTNATFDGANSTAGWTETAPGSGIYTLSIGALAAGGSGSVMFAVTPNDPQNAGVDQLVNAVTIADDGANGTDEDLSDNSDDDVDTLVAAPDLFVTKDDALTIVSAGGSTVYTINYGNNGSQDATGVVLTETLPVGATIDPGNSTAGWTETSPGSGIYTLTIGALASGGNGSVAFAVTVDDPQNAGVDQLINAVSIADDGANGPDEDLSNNSDDDIDTLVAAPNLFVTKDDSQTVVSAGGSTVYTINYGNTGSQGATGVVLTEMLPAGATFDSGNSTVGWTESSPGSGVYTLTIGALASGASGNVTFAVTVNDPQDAGIDQLVNAVSIADDGANGADEDLSDNTDDDIDTLVAAPDLFVTKDDGVTVVQAGSLVVYTINYGNNGSQGATGVVLTETLPTNATFDAGNSSAGWTETAPGSGVYTLTIGAVAAGSNGSVTLAVFVDDPQNAGVDQLFNMVSIADDGANGADEDLSDNSDGDTDTLVAAPDLFVTKDDGVAVVQADNLVVYTINYGNNGSQDATGVVLTETLPTNAVFNAGSSTAGWTETAPGSGVYTLSVGSLAAGANGSVAFAVIVDDPQSAGVDQLINGVSIADDGTNGADEDLSDNSDDDIDTLVAAPDLFVTKDDLQTVVNAGDSAIYTINFGNNGTQDATGVVLTEVLAPGSTFNAGASTAGWTETALNSGIFTLNIGALAAGASASVTFAVNVDDPQSAGVDQLINNVSIADDGTNGADEDVSDNSDDDTDTLVAAPDLFISKDDGDTVVTVGDLVIYTINYGNDGTQDATGVVITETLPPGAQFDSANSTSGWIETAPGSGVFQFTVGALASGDTRNVTFAVTVNDPLAAGIDDLVNNVSIADDGTNGPDEDSSDNSDDDTDTVLAAPDLFVTKDDSLTTVTAGDTVTYTINYGNDGTQGATGVVLTETLPVGAVFNGAGSSAGWVETAPNSGIFQLNLGAVASGVTGSVTFSVIVDDPLAAGIDQLINSVTIADDGANGGDLDTSDNMDSDTDTIIAGPDLFVLKDDGNAIVTTGDLVVYTINYGNGGSQDATGVVLTETLPVGATFNEAASTSGWTETSPGSGVYQFTIGNLDVGDTGSVAFAVTVDDPQDAGVDDLVNNVSIGDDGANGPDENTSDNQANDVDVLDATPDLFVTKDDSQSVVTVGDLVIYTINYGNIGNQGATGVVLTETLPAGVSFDAANSTVGWVEATPGSGVFQFAIGGLAAGINGTVDFAVIVDDPIAAGIDDLVNAVMIADDGANGPDPNLANNQATDVDIVDAEPDLFVSKDDGVSVVTVGDLVIYTINYGNDGSQGATGVVLTEAMPAGTSFDAANSTSGWVETAPNSGVFEFAIGNLPSGTNGTVAFAIRVDNPVAAGIDQLINNVTISDDGSNGPDEDPSDNSDTDVDTLDANPELEVTKTDGVTVVVPGDVAIYTINYANTGGQEATGVVLTETLPVGGTFNAASSTAGWVETTPGSGIYTLTIGSLVGGGSGTALFAVTIDDPAAAGLEQINNTVSIADDGTNGAETTLVDNTDSDSDTLVAAPDLYVTKTDGDASTTPGGLAIYTITYGNDGSQGATGVRLFELLPANTTFNAANSDPGWTETFPGEYEFVIGNLASGETGTVAFAVNVNPGVPSGVPAIENLVQITDDGTNGMDEDDEDNRGFDDTPLITAPDVTITKTDGGITAAPGDVVVYTLAYANIGNVGTAGVVVTEFLPNGTTFNAAGSTIGWTETSPGSGTFEFTIDTLAAGESGTLLFAVLVDDPLAGGITQLINNASIVDDGSSGADANLGNNDATDDTPIVSGPDLFVTKDDGQSVVQVGDLLVYTINYGNTGSRGATGVTITETLPAGLIFNAANSTVGWVETSPGSGVFEFDAGAVGVGTNLNVSFAVNVDDPLASGIDQLINNVSITDDGTNGGEEDPTNNDDSDTNSVDAAPNLFILKDDGQSVAMAGDTLVYSITYGNNGDQDSTGVFLTETLPAGATFNAAGSTPGWILVTPGTYRFNIGDVDVGDGGSVLFAVTVNDPVAAGRDQLINNASIADDGANGVEADVSDNLASDTDTIVAAPELWVTKDDGGASTTPGGSIAWTISYGNDGSQDATGVVLTEILPTNATFDAAGSDPNWTETMPGSGVYTLTIGALAANDSGTVTFAVRVDSSIPGGVSQLDNTVAIADDGANGPTKILRTTVTQTIRHSFRPSICRLLSRTRTPRRFPAVSLSIHSTT